MNWRQVLDQIAAQPETGQSFITDGQFTVAYRELHGLLDGVTAALKSRGIAPDVCVAVECANSVAGGLLLLGLLREGYSFVLVPPGMTNEIKPTPRFCRFKITAAADGAPLSAGGLLVSETNPGWNGSDASGENLAAGKLLLRTSGSMGASKIVVHDHRKLMGNAANCVRKYDFGPASRCVIPVPIAHMYGFGAAFLPAIMAGASIDLQQQTNVLKYLDREKRFQPTIAFVTPAICEMLGKIYKTPRTGYAVMVTSGQRISDELFTAFDPMIGGRLINQYGSTEMGATAACDPGDSFTRRIGTIGTPMQGVKLRIANDETGELYAQHPFGYEGYLDEEGTWLHKAEPGGWYRTGDLAKSEPGGRMVVLGRADASVNRNGYLVLLADIERVMEKLVAQAVVVAGKADETGVEPIAAFCVARDGHAADGAQIRAHCFSVLPGYAIPDQVHVLDNLPMLASGKVDRQSLIARIEKPRLSG